MNGDYRLESNGRPNRRGTCVLWGFIGVAGYFLWTEHQAHVVQYLPFLLLLACPLMHLFHHGGHARHGEQPDRRDRAPNTHDRRHQP